MTTQHRDDATPPAVEFTTAELVQRATGLAQPGVRRVLGIAGAPGAGKSTLAELLADALGPTRAALAGMDAFHLSNEVLHRLGRYERKGAIDTFDDAGYATLMERLARAQPGDGPVYVPRFDRTTEESINAAAEVTADVALVVSEGNYLLAAGGAWPRARAAMAEVWFLAPAEEVRRARLTARHERFGRSSEEAHGRARGPDEVNARYILATARHADLVIRWRD